VLQVSSAEVDRIDSFGARVTNATSMIHSPHVLLID